mgnify:CR=1 FL=1
MVPPDMSTIDSSTELPSYIYKSVMVQSFDETSLNSRLYQNETDELCTYFNSTMYDCNEEGTFHATEKSTVKRKNKRQLTLITLQPAAQSARNRGAASCPK